MKAAQIYQAIVDRVVGQADSGVYYLNPLWMLEPEVTPILEDKDTLAFVREMLELTVKKKNAISNRQPLVVDSLYKIIHEDAQPMMDENEIKLLQNLLEFTNQKQEDNKFADGWSFAKKN